MTLLLGSLKLPGQVAMWSLEYASIGGHEWVLLLWMRTRIMEGLSIRKHSWVRLYWEVRMNQGQRRAKNVTISLGPSRFSSYLLELRQLNKKPEHSNIPHNQTNTQQTSSPGYRWHWLYSALVPLELLLWRHEQFSVHSCKRMGYRRQEPPTLQGKLCILLSGRVLRYKH